ncbi:SDR family oxidoreductase [Chromobacterium violaceum]|uniref:SDR family oxidoreductase n=1 Tax=Chromobacterium violaceum TaxID=536 RepID=UPI001E554648|nr:SDR family oxidoreductase [Chromobacterium violaceum]
MGQLEGKVAIITGASAGIGYEAAKLFAREGAQVVAVARRARELEQLAAAIRQDGGDLAIVVGDAREESTAKQAVETARRRYGGLDIAFNNAGATGESAPVHEITPEAWHFALDTNLTSAFLAARQQIPAMLQRGGGSLIFTSTFVGHTAGFPGMGAYAASKAGLIGLTQVIAAEYGARGIRANALLPGGTDTEMGRAAAPTPEARGFVEGLHALKRLARPEEIARAALFLASDAASFVTGSAMLADGGVSIQRSRARRALSVQALRPERERRGAMAAGAVDGDHVEAVVVRIGPGRDIG